jgi:hypothetical protein
LHVPVSLTLTGSVVVPTITTQPSSKTITARRRSLLLRPAGLRR